MGGGGFVDHGNLFWGQMVGGNQVTPGTLRDGDDVIGSTTVEGQGQIQVPAVEAFVVSGETAKYEVVNSEDGGDRAQR